MKKMVVLVLLVILFSVGCSVEDKKVFQLENVNVGEYIELGKYNNEPILWRIINIDSEGDPVLLSDKIISFKTFDADGNYHIDKERQSYGSNYWENSNIRQWLNSEDKSGIKWLQNPPSAQSFRVAINPYDKEKGFLADGNFTKDQRKFIKTVKHKSILHTIDSDTKDGGNEKLISSKKIEDVVQNYDDTFYKDVEDKVYFLSTEELYTFLWKNKQILGEDYYKGMPTEKAIYKLPMKSEELDKKKYWTSWLRTPEFCDPTFVRVVEANGDIHGRPATFSKHGGVRPVITIIYKNMFFESGDGTELNPYILNI